jgi:hypothetical protein
VVFPETASMAPSVEHGMPPRPECEFDFNLPHGLDTEGSHPLHGNPATSHINNNAAEDAAMPDRDFDALFVGDPDDDQQPMNYETFPSGFSDDEGGEEASNRSWAAQQSRKTSSKNKKSPRRSEGSDGAEEASPKTKRPRNSLFGDPFQEVDEDEDKDDMDDKNLEVDDPETSKPDIRHRMSSLNLDLQQVENDEDVQYAQDTRPYDIGFDLASFDQDDMPPNNQVSPEAI